ncbi:MAG: DUF2723 domain-containing protein [Acidobacteria bacterium]|nr:DUF2723 domain-containing protein [Acidobacteriota bacterium]
MLALALYISTLLPGLDWCEGAQAQLRAYTAQVDSGAAGHPVYFWLTHLFSRVPSPNPAWWINFPSALLSAGALFLFVLAAFEVLAIASRPLPAPSRSSSGRLPSAGLDETNPAPAGRAELWGVALATVSLGVSQAYWFCATHPRPLAMNATVLMGTIYCALSLMRRPRPGAVLLLALLLGLSAGIHPYTALLAPLFFFWITGLYRRHRLVLSPASVLAAAGSFLAGLAPYLFVLLREVARVKMPSLVVALTVGASSTAGGAGAAEPANLAAMLSVVAWDSARSLLYNLLPWGMAAAVAGMALMRRQRLLCLLLVGCFAANWILAAGYAVPEEPGRYQPAWMLLALLQAPAWRGIMQKWPRLAWPALLAVLLVPPILYAQAPRLLAGNAWFLEMAPVSERSGAGEGTLRYQLNPSGYNNRSAEYYGQQLLQSLPGEAMLLAHHQADSSTYYIVRFLQQQRNQYRGLVVDNLRGYSGPVSLDRLFRLHPGSSELYLSQLHPVYQMRNCVIEPVSPPDKGRRAGLYRVAWQGIPDEAASLPLEDSHWHGTLSLFQSPFALQVSHSDGNFYVRLRFSHPLLYPSEARVDHVQVQPGSIAFTYGGLHFKARIFKDSMLGQWWIPALPEYHGTWELFRKG